MTEGSCLCLDYQLAALSDVVLCGCLYFMGGQAVLEREGSPEKGTKGGPSPQPLKCSGKFPNASHAGMEGSGVDMVDGPSSALRFPGSPRFPLGSRDKGWGLLGSLGGLESWVDGAGGQEWALPR